MIKDTEIVPCKVPEIESCMNSLKTITEELEEMAKTLTARTEIICYHASVKDKSPEGIVEKRNTVLGQDMDAIYWRLRAVYGSLLDIKQSLEI